MTTVLLYGSNGDKISNEICNFLATFGILRITEKKIFSNTATPKFVVIESGNFQNVHIENGIIVIVGKIDNGAELKLNGDFKGIVFSLDKEALQILKRAEVPTITCGMAEEDTLSLSSIKEDSAIICVNRKIKTLSGEFIEPQEHKINVKIKTTDYAVLAASAILMCSNEFQEH